MELDKMTTEEVQAVLRLLVDLEREDLALLLQERREAEREGQLH
jgi:hypothetical protein